MNLNEYEVSIRKLIEMTPDYRNGKVSRDRFENLRSVQLGLNDKYANEVICWEPKK